jgi:hypothetical protein
MVPTYNPNIEGRRITWVQQFETSLGNIDCSPSEEGKKEREGRKEMKGERERIVICRSQEKGYAMWCHAWKHESLGAELKGNTMSRVFIIVTPKKEQIRDDCLV